MSGDSSGLTVTSTLLITSAAVMASTLIVPPRGRRALHRATSIRPPRAGPPHGPKDPVAGDLRHLPVRPGRRWNDHDGARRGRDGEVGHAGR
nr:hypothetical protein GCM10017588_53630 [Microbispora rosea subsp. aerata]